MLHCAQKNISPKSCPSAGLLLGHRLRRWPNNKPALRQRTYVLGIRCAVLVIHLAATTIKYLLPKATDKQVHGTVPPDCDRQIEAYDPEMRLIP